MADEPQDDVLDTDLDEGLDPDVNDQDQRAEPKPGEGDEDGLDFSFGDEAAPASGERDTPLIKHLRTQLREEQRARKEAESRAPSQQIVVGEKPTMEACDWDADRYEGELEAYHARKAQAQAQETEQQAAQRKAQEEWNRDHQRYQAERLTLMQQAPQAEEAEAVATSSLSEVQQAVIVRVANKPAALLAALGRYPDKLSTIAQITDPLKLAAAVARLEGGLRVMPRRRNSEPEQIASGSAPMARSSDKELERLEREAARTNDRSKVVAYKASLTKRAA